MNCFQKGTLGWPHALARDNPGPLMVIDGPCVMGVHHGTGLGNFLWTYKGYSSA